MPLNIWRFASPQAFYSLSGKLIPWFLISAALLVPALAWAALAAAALVALEMRLAVQPAETPAA